MDNINNVMNIQSDVRHFMEKFNKKVYYVPNIPSSDETNLSIYLIVEEYNELLAALQNDNLIEIADGAADLIYVILYMLNLYGINLLPIWEAVHQANMKKCNDINHFGKIMKPAGWVPPDIKQILIEQGANL